MFVLPADGPLERRLELVVQRGGVRVGSGHLAVEIALQHGERSIDEVPQVIGEVGVESIGHRLPADLAVPVER